MRAPRQCIRLRLRRPQARTQARQSTGASRARAAAARLAAQYPQPGTKRVYAIKAGKLVDPEKGATQSNQIILVRGKKIEAVGSNVPIPPDAKVIDLSNSTVLPGLFDAHTHLCMTLKRPRDGYSYYITTLMERPLIERLRE